MERDTHFQGFAKLLLEELKPDLALLFVALGEKQIQREKFSVEQAESIIQTVIARRAFDLVVHALDTCPLEAFEIMGNGVDYVPDLTAWTEQE